MKKTPLKSPNLAIEIAVQTTKLFIALATSILAFTVTFTRVNNNIISCEVKTSWILLGISIIAGVFVLQKIIGELATKDSVSLYTSSIKWASIIQNLSFIAGVLWVAFFILIK